MCVIMSYVLIPFTKQVEVDVIKNYIRINKRNMTDTDGDGFTNIDEDTAGTNPFDSTSVPVDTDGDGLADNGVDQDDDNDGFTDMM